MKWTDLKRGDETSKSGEKWKMESGMEWSEDFWWNVYIVIYL
jgi:hypothetical protein